MNYLYECPSCKSNNVTAATNDGGSVQYCNDCKLTYKAIKLNSTEPTTFLSRPQSTNRYCVFKK